MKKNYTIKKFSLVVILILFFPIIALASDCPRVSYDIIPGVVVPNKEFSLMARSTDFSPEEEDMKQMVYQWCLDGVYLGTINANGAVSDKIAGISGNRYIQNDKYGDIRGEFSGVCNPNGAVGGPLQYFSWSKKNRHNFRNEWSAKCVHFGDIVYCNQDNYNTLAGHGKIEDNETIFKDDVAYFVIQVGDIEYEDFIPPDRIIVREPKVDSDNDGLDDNWEIKYFKGRKINIHKIERVCRLVDPEGSDEEGDVEEPVEEEDAEEPAEDEVVEGTTEEGEEGEVVCEIVESGEEDEPNYFYLPSDDDARVLSLVRPDRVISPDNPEIYSNDPDKDGWEYPYTDDDEYNESWKIGAPFIKSSTSDMIADPAKKDQYNIYREYIIGTDPLNSDTDGDGIPDMKDFVGLQQNNVHVIPKTLDYGDELSTMLRVFGIRGQFRNEDEGEKYAVSTYPIREGTMISGESIEECGFDPTPEDENSIEVGMGLPLKVGWGIRPSPIRAGSPDDVVVTVEAVKGTQVSGLELAYRWFRDINDKSVLQEGESGDGKQYLSFVTDKEPCGEEIIGLEIIDETDKMTFQEITIPVGINTSFDATVIGNVDPTNSDIVDFNQHIGADIGDYSDPSTFDFLIDGVDPFKDFINSETSNQGFRKWDLVQLEVGNIESSWGDACTSKYGGNYDVVEGDTKHLWNFKRREQTRQSGKGRQYSKAYFILKGDARQILEESGGDDENSQVYDGTDWVNYELIDSNNEVLARESMSFPLIGPSVITDVEGASIETSEEDTDDVQYYANYGDEITVNAGWRYFRPSRGFETRWIRNDVPVGGGNASGDTTDSTFSFIAGYNSAGNKINSAKDKIKLEVDSVVNVSGGAEEIEKTEKTIVINLQEEDDSFVDTALGGALRNLIPSYYRNIFNLFMVSCIAGGALLFALSFMGKVGRSK